MDSHYDKKVLVVGAGGIGCELLKNLVLSGFTDIEVVTSQLIQSTYKLGGPGYN